MLGFNRAGISYFYVKNLQGDVTAVVDGDGEIINTYSYDAWGSLLTSDEEVPQPIRYRGYYSDGESGLYYCQSRYYNPGWGRFLNADLVLIIDEISGMNLYQYCKNDPLGYKDVDGNDPVPNWARTIVANKDDLYDYLLAYKVKKVNLQSSWAGLARNCVNNALKLLEARKSKYNDALKKLSEITNTKCTNKNALSKRKDVEIIARVIYGENTWHASDQEGIASVIYNRYITDKNAKKSTFHSGTLTYKSIVTYNGAFQAYGSPGQALKAMEESDAGWFHAKILAVLLVMDQGNQICASYKIDGFNIKRCTITKQKFFLPKDYYDKVSIVRDKKEYLYVGTTRKNPDTKKNEKSYFLVKDKIVIQQVFYNIDETNFIFK
jgi:RHS repeat-associated protein